MKVILNYVGQLRIYSLVDLVLLLVAVEATSNECIGVIFLHTGFLAYLESKHSHNGRTNVPKWVWFPAILAGGFFYQHWQVIPFVVCSYLYTKKNKGSWGIWSPIFRGLQFFFLVSGIVGYSGWLSCFALVLTVTRNAIGDVRDVEKDKAGGMTTLPILFGLHKSIQSGHLMAMIVSSTIWWGIADLSGCVLVWVILIQLVTYNLTPR